MIEAFTWRDFDTALGVLVEKIASSRKVFENIYGIPRGGLIVAVALSHRLNLPMLVNREEVGRATLVVDDISDSGKSLTPFRNRSMATLHVVPTTCTYPTFFAKERRTDWVVYPWEQKGVMQ